MKKILSIFTVLFTALTFGQNVDPYLQPNSSPTSGQWNKGALKVDSVLVVPSRTRDSIYTNPNLGYKGRIQVNSETSNFEYNNDSIWLTLNNNYVDIRDFGAVGDSITDNYEAFIDAVAYAKATNKYLYVADGYTFLIVYESQSSIEMAGCPGIIGGGTLLWDTLPNTDYPHDPVLAWTGEVELIGSDTPAPIGDTEATIDTGLELNAGDTVFLISTENVGNYEENTNKGQRLTLHTYDPITGVATFYENFAYDITSGYFYLNSVQPRVELRGVKIFATETISRKCITFTFCDVYVENVFINHFAKHGIAFSQSKGTSINFKCRDFYHPDSSTSYGIQIAGLSLVETYNADLVGGRHAISHGDDGIWSTSQAGGLDDEPMFMSSVSTLFGGNFANDENSNTLCVDTHGGCRQFKMIGGWVKGGISLGGQYSEIIDVDVEPKKNNLNHNIVFGTRNEDPAIPTGEHYITNCRFHEGNLFYLGSSMDRVSFKNVSIVGNEYSTTAFEMANYTANVYDINHLTIDGLYINVNNDAKPNLTLRLNSNSIIRNIYSNRVLMMPIQDVDGSYDMLIENVFSRNSYAQAILNNNSALNYIGRFILRNIYVTNAGDSGVYFIAPKALKLENVISNYTAFSGTRIVAKNSSIVINNLESRFNTSRGLQITRDGSDTASELSLVSADLRGNTGANRDIAAGITILQNIGVQPTTGDTYYAYADAKVANNLTASTTVAPSKTAVNDALALKANKAGDTYTGTHNFTGATVVGLSVTNTSLVSSQTASDLNTLYPTAPEGFEVLAPNITPARVYKKTSVSGQWIDLVGTTLNP